MEQLRHYQLGPGREVRILYALKDVVVDAGSGWAKVGSIGNRVGIGREATLNRSGYPLAVRFVAAVESTAGSLVNCDGDGQGKVRGRPDHRQQREGCQQSVRTAASDPPISCASDLRDLCDRSVVVSDAGRRVWRRADVSIT